MTSGATEDNSIFWYPLMHELLRTSSWWGVISVVAGRYSFARPKTGALASGCTAPDYNWEWSNSR